MLSGWGLKLAGAAGASESAPRHPLSAATARQLATAWAGSALTGFVVASPWRQLFR